MVMLDALFTGFFVTAFLRMTEEKTCHPEQSEGSRMASLDALFTGFFVTAFLRMTGEKTCHPE